MIFKRAEKKRNNEEGEKGHAIMTLKNQEKEKVIVLLERHHS
jgi:hypothetical protein